VSRAAYRIDGVIAGAVAFVTGFAATLLLERDLTDQDYPLFRAAYLSNDDRATVSYVGDVTPRLESAGWLYNRLHFASTDGVYALNQFSDVDNFNSYAVLDFVGDPSLFLFLLPPLVLGTAGFVVGIRDRVSTRRTAVATGCSIAAGYGLLALCSLRVFAFTHAEMGGASMDGHFLAIAVAPDLLSVVVLTGIVYPVAAGTAGAYLAARYRSPTTSQSGSDRRSVLASVPVPDWVRRSVVSRFDARDLGAGAVAGVASFGAGLVGVVLLTPRTAAAVVERFPGSESTTNHLGGGWLGWYGPAVDRVTIAGWRFYEAHFVSIDATRVSSRGDSYFEYVPESSALLGLLPLAALLLAGFLLARRAAPATTSEAAFRGAHVLAGYLPLAYLSAILLTFERSIGPGTILTVAPVLHEAVLLAGIMFPLVFGAAGGVLYGLLADAPRGVGR